MAVDGGPPHLMREWGCQHSWQGAGIIEPMKVPIACSLNVVDAGDRIAEWREVLRRDIGDPELDGTTAALPIEPGDDTLLRVIDLAEREQQCCTFFDFAVELRSAGRVLRIVVPDGAEAILADLLALRSS